MKNEKKNAKRTGGNGEGTYTIIMEALFEPYILYVGSMDNVIHIQFRKRHVCR